MQLKNLLDYEQKKKSVDKFYIYENKKNSVVNLASLIQSPNPKFKDNSSYFSQTS